MSRKLRAWLAMGRPPFHLVGVLPFALGTLLAWREPEPFRWDVCAWGVAGVVLVMLATYYAGEYWDYAEDSMSAGLSRFAGGSQVVQQGSLPRRAPLWGSVASLLLAVAVGAVLQFGYNTGPWTLPLGIVGILGGFLYSTRPVRWVSSGLGELWIGFCYGWLPVAVGYYLQRGRIPTLVHWLAIPIACTIVNVILLNEFPDYAADSATGKCNLTVRIGRERAARVYGGVAAASWLAMLATLRRGVPAVAVWPYLPVLAASLWTTAEVLRGRWCDRVALERLCAATLLVNLGTTATYLLAFGVTR
jgi:1,4-dihydroxy-2-naphthoate octaprenyltransferase